VLGGVRRLTPIVACVLFVSLCIATAGAWSLVGTAKGLAPAERCAGAFAVADPGHDGRSWVVPPRLPESNPRYGDLRKLELRATAAGVCVRWTTAAPAPPGATFVFGAGGPFVSEGKARVAAGYGFDLQLRRSGAVATYGLDRLNSNARRILHVRAGQTGSVVSAFVPIAELNRPPANQPNRPPFPYRTFTFEARVLTAPDRRGNMRVDFWPQESHIQTVAADIKGRLCFPCHDPRFSP
jgi:hypothetical protein